MSSTGRWDDLLPRALSAAILALVGLIGLALGGVWFQALVAAAAGAMAWELARMIAPDDAQLAWPAAAAALVVVGLARWLDDWAAALALLLAAGFWLWAPRLRRAAAGYILLICVAGIALIAFRDGAGLPWLFWLLLVVIATDIAGYFAGRALGGPKFWPAISPKKTWSGTAAGWVAAALVGALFAAFTRAGFALVPLSVLVSFAGQMGDIAESAIKRRCGVKDASNLIPGHGGVMDRFDALLGATAALWLLSLIVPLPPFGA